MWQDMQTHWAWSGDPADYIQPPTKKRIEYAKLDGPAPMIIAVTVFDGDKPTKINRAELAWHIKQGATLTSSLA